MSAIATRFPNAPLRSIRRCFSSKIEQIHPVQGMKDRFGDENKRFQWITQKGAKLAGLYGFEQISTPILEYSQVFERTLGEDSDVVGKELFSFESRRGNRLTMRPEGTASVTRALISQKQYVDLPQKYYYCGPMFRHERPQKGRLRQFEQFGVEFYGERHPSADVETIELAAKFLGNLGLNSVTLEINSLGDNASRLNYKVALKDYLSKHQDKLSEDSVRRLSSNPLRILDSKSPQDIEILENCPSLLDYLNQSSRQRFDFVTGTLSQLKIPFSINPRLVRGLDYYQDTVFEFKVSNPLLGAQQGTVLAGGRYDGLVEKMGGPQGIPSIGWAAGMERLSLLIDDTAIPANNRIVAVIPVPDREVSSESDAVSSSSILHGHAMEVATNLRGQGIQVELMHLPGSKSQLPKQLIKAIKRNASHAVLIGTDELSKGMVVLKDLEKAEQKHCRVDELAGELRNVILSQ